jgi:hypothetical protein
VVEYIAWLRTVAEMTENNAATPSCWTRRTPTASRPRAESEVAWKARVGLRFWTASFGIGPRFHPGAAFGP